MFLADIVFLGISQTIIPILFEFSFQIFLNFISDFPQPYFGFSSLEFWIFLNFILDFTQADYP